MSAELAFVQRQARAQSAHATALHALVATVSSVGYGVVVLSAFRGGASVADLTLVITSAAGFQGAFLAVTERWGACWRALALFETYRVMIQRLDARAGSAGQVVPPLFDELRVEHVSFRYHGSEDLVLRDVNLVIRRGEMVGLVGANGAGKSTLVKLIAGFYTPSAGRITWNGLELTDLDVAAFRSRLGAVFQDFMTYDLTLAENIGLGDIDHLDDLSRIRIAATKVEADGIADRLPTGYATSLSRVFEPESDGAAAAALSGGEWQRVAIARALMRDDRPLLLLDEPTSGMDPQREDRLRHTLFARRPDQAVLCISHRLSSLRDCDRILVLDDGVIVEQGSHEQLMEMASGSYRAMFRAQANGYVDDDLRRPISGPAQA